MSHINAMMDKIKEKESEIDYYFKPYISEGKSTWKRHPIHKELIADFTSEISSFGFYPYIQKKYKDQIKDLRIMKFRRNPFNNYLYSYIKQKDKITPFKNKNKPNKPNKSNVKRYTKRTNSTQSSDIREDNFLSKGLHSMKNKQSIFEKYLHKSKSSPKVIKKIIYNNKKNNLPEIMDVIDDKDIEYSSDLLFKNTNKIILFKKFEMCANCPYLIPYIKNLLPKWENTLKDNKKYLSHIIGRYIKDNDINKNKRKIIETDISKRKEKIINLTMQKRLLNKAANNNIKKKIKKSKSEITKQKRLQDLYEIEKNKNGIVQVAQKQKRRNEIQEKMVIEDNKKLSDKDPLILYGLVDRKTRQTNKKIELNNNLDEL